MKKKIKDISGTPLWDTPLLSPGIALGEYG